MKIIFTILFTLVLVSCGQIFDREVKLDVGTDEIGRWVMQGGRSDIDEIFLLDTVTGYLQKCTYRTNNMEFFCIDVHGAGL